MSFKSEIPFIKEARIKGIAMSFSNFTKMVPKGLIQLATNVAPPSSVVIPNPKRIPTIIPIKIFQCNASFFMCLGQKLRF